ncbi:Bis(5'-adenosyl)-triphosphatase enpp4 [Mactra antiquata]
MMALKFIIIIISIQCLVSYVSGIKSKVLLISMDGFRWDYIQKASTPNFDEFAAMGTKADYINNTFVTKTFPCHYSIATGLYEESHGIVANQMFDPSYPIPNNTFNMKTKDTEWWDGGEPIWVTARKNGLKSAVYFWPGSETKIRGYRPNIWFPYDESVSFEHRINTVVSWLSDDQYDIDLALLYFHEPDATGHKFGPDSNEVKNKVVDMDNVLGYLMRKMTSAKLWQTTNVIVTSDHGMTEIDYATRHIDLSNYIDIDQSMTYKTYGPFSNILTVDGLEDEVFNNLSKAHEHMKIYRKADIPDHWHYKNNRRILPLLAVADEGWTIVKGPEDYNLTVKGAHGYDNRLQSMKPIFYARGPNIRSNTTAFPFNSVDIYPLICELLGITPAPNNGTLDNTNTFIIDNSTGSASYTWSCSTLLTICFIIVFLHF